MTNRIVGSGLAVAAIAALAVPMLPIGAQAEGVLPVEIPAPEIDVEASGDTATAVFAGGCFWGVQGVFQHVEGVTSAVSGYSGGEMENPSYEDVLTETTGHAEAVRVEYDPSVVSYGDLMQVFFSVIADPTQLNRQGPDVGESYRSALFVMNEEQEEAAAAYIDQLEAAGVYPSDIVTEVTDYTNFYRAEDYHQDNAYTKDVNAGYIEYYDIPKIEDFQAMYPDMWRDRPVLVIAANYE